MSIRLTGAALWASSALLLHRPAIAQSAITDPAVSSTEQQQEEIVVTGKYSAASAVTGTKTDTPLIEVPQSIA
ncbi:hypothetical protein, partial [Polymorphobacter multimanifer]|uniref:hypothetical protein n=1 Tax=Polymorphobacter multimanifer TaxID=1070431 RepID=UPI00166B152E